MANNKKKRNRGYSVALQGVKEVIRILVIVLVIMVLFFVGQKFIKIGYDVFYEKPVDTGQGVDRVIKITDDMTSIDIGNLLKDNGLIDESVISFWLQEKLSKYHNELLPGTYILNSSQVVSEMLPILAGENTEGQPGSIGSAEQEVQG